jgi:hypothetical protein
MKDLVRRATLCSCLFLEVVYCGNDLGPKCCFPFSRWLVQQLGSSVGPFVLSFDSVYGSGFEPHQD